MTLKHTCYILTWILVFCGCDSYSPFSTRIPLIPRKILFSSPEKAYPQISPDGRYLAYCAPVNGVLNIWIKTIGKDDDHVITKEAKRNIYSYCWAPNNQQILYEQNQNGDENNHIFSVDLATQQTTDLTPFDGVKAEIIAKDKHIAHKIVITMNKENSKLFDAYYLDLDTGNLTLAAKNPGSIVYWQADANLQIRAAVATNANGTQELLFRANSDDDWHSILSVTFEDTLKDELYCGLLGFSMDGQSIYLNSSINANTRQLIRFDPKTKNYTTIASDQENDLSWVTINQDSYQPEIACWEKERLVHKALNPSMEQLLSALKSVSNGDLFYINRNADGNIWVLGFLYDTKPVDYYLYNSNTKQSTRLFCSRPQLEKYQMAAMEPISLTARDGLKLNGYITYPVTNKKHNIPLVLNVHGGPFGRDTWGFDREVQWFANRGYVCLQINFRGSSGYGKEFLAAGNKEWGGKMHNDLIDAVSWAIQNGIADKKRIAIYGCSYGGYAALVGATFTPDVFCCAVDVCGPSNLITVLQTLPPYWSTAQWEKRIGNLNDKDFLKSRSPLYKIQNIKKPIFIAHGTHDVRVTQKESEQMVNEMKRNGVPHEYLLFPDEGHGFSRPENQLTFFAAAEKFLTKYLGGRVEP